MTTTPPSIPQDFTLPEKYHALVLLIDDQAFVSDAVHRAFERQGDIDYHYCPQPAEAVSTANLFRPTVILLDLVMPQMSGLQVLSLLRENPETRETPVVVLSSREEPRTKSEAFACGANDYLVKLPDPVELRARVRYHSRAHLNRIQREEAFKALRESQQQLVRKNAELSLLNEDYKRALRNLRRLGNLLPICSRCESFRNDEAYRQEVETFLAENPGLLQLKSLCPLCAAREEAGREESKGESKP